MIYLPVDDPGESLRRVEMEGGKVLKVTHDDAGEAAYASMEDPQGGQLAFAQG